MSQTTDSMEMLTFLDRKRVQKAPRGHSLAKQSMKAECDINTIMRRYMQTGVIEHVRQVQGRYGDFSVVPDYQTALNHINRAREMFMQLPAELRAKFQNDPHEFLVFAENPENEEAMRELGLLPSKREAPEAPTDVAPSGDTPAPKDDA